MRDVVFVALPLRCVALRCVALRCVWGAGGGGGNASRAPTSGRRALISRHALTHSHSESVCVCPKDSAACVVHSRLV